jgi:hypothetical protein
VGLEDEQQREFLKWQRLVNQIGWSGVSESQIHYLLHQLSNLSR